MPFPIAAPFGENVFGAAGVRRKNSSSHGFAVPAPSEMGPLAKPRRFPAKDKLSCTAKASLLEGGGIAQR